MQALASHPAALAAIAANPAAFANFASNANAFRDAASKAAADARMASNAAAFQRLASDNNAMQALARDPGVFSAIAANAAAFKALAGQPQALCRCGQQRCCGRSPAAIGRRIERGDRGDCGQQRGVRGAPVAAAGDGRDRGSLEGVCGARRRIRRRWPRSCPMHRPSAASRNNANAFRNAASKAAADARLASNAAAFQNLASDKAAMAALSADPTGVLGDRQQRGRLRRASRATRT